MSATTMVHVRVDKKIKAQATEALSAMGLSMSDAVRVFLTRVVAEQRIPFTLRVPNAETQEAMAEADELVKAHRARFSNPEELFDSFEKDSCQ
jgi:DNA-damage-inducible protein J